MVMQNPTVLPPFTPLTEVPAYVQQINHLIASGRLDEAAKMIAVHVQAHPDDLLAGTMQAVIARLQGRFQDSSAFCNQVLQKHPGYYPALVEHARFDVSQGNWTQAQDYFFVAHQQCPSALDMFLEWAEVLNLLGRWQTAVQVTEHGLKLNPHSTDLQFTLGRILQSRHQNQAALDAYQPLLAVPGVIPNLYNNYGASLVELNRHAEAKSYLDIALEQEPNNYLVWVNLASWYRNVKDLEKAEQANEQAIRLMPSYAIAHNNYGLVLGEMQKWQASHEQFKQALALDPSYTGAQWNLAMSYLRLGDYEAGWPLHEARWEGSGELRDKKHNLPKPQWNGESLKDKILFVWGEQGLGDALQFSRYVPRIIDFVKAQGGRVEYCCFKSLHSLFSSSFQHLLNTRIIEDDYRPLPEFDYHCPLMMLPLMFGTRLETIPNQVPYLHPTENRTDYWRERLAGDKKLRVGLVWTGSKTHQRNPYRAVGVEAYTRFKDITNANFYSLQFAAQEDIAKAESLGLHITDWTPEMKDFNDSAAFMKNLDLVITVCTSTSHLAGALGIKTWVPLDVNPHWVWLIDREDSPWYPNSKLYRQKNFLEWEPVLQKLHTDLHALAQQKTNT